MKHPGTNELLEFHFQEMEPLLLTLIEEHVASCDACRAFLRELDSIEDALAAGVDEMPPADGLERVLAGVTPVLRDRQRSPSRAMAIVPSFLAIATGAVAVIQGGLMGAALFLLGGGLLTLAIAPVLIIESQRRVS